VEHGARVFAAASCLHRPDIVGGVQERACASLLKRFFADLR
jgi:tRNA(Arg) A34 adenosine deaminase TadA